MCEKEVATFEASEKELVEAIDSLDRAIGILQKEMSKNPAALAQVDTKNLDSMVKSLSAVINAASFTAQDQKNLAALVQSQQGAESDDEELGAPAAAVYKTHSSSIFDVLEDMKEKALGGRSWNLVRRFIRDCFITIVPKRVQSFRYPPKFVPNLVSLDLLL